MDNKATNKLRREYPNFTPLKVASELLGVSPRQLSKLVVEGRNPAAVHPHLYRAADCVS